ncbi:2-amino-4-hydroxy-6-hydroxymethyldihydropteridine diphosphokinase [Dyadobacter jejuensis]|uniref:2-amino-4-hydroxy-6-hydroxymethyldihydropteridine pyrophosphokinase n=1 Tax=Dyadobacter jejuensis TaxID=1082580 RepID=A0A316AI95_9BACT|nr:2-amino-4-hydroxy-6-hydroxymethyldihydropteridine diphosphokinase [Dyadobacter jejuensis]PWJ56998.1 2-amino-4-hydroxy-6-hydroxymethyldihydropteridine diphosphokinase [Dyadobacter jejuensis]
MFVSDMDHDAPNTVLLLLGSNLGDRQDLLFQATKAISLRIGTITGASSLYETAPWGVTDQPPFLNQVLQVQTSLSPEVVLETALAIELALGRVRLQRWAARVIDIDILYFNDLITQQEKLTIPHPRLQDRRFTLIPLVEIAADWIHPVFMKSNKILLEDCEDKEMVTLVS